ncbi:dTDP-4-dehydrorhamnose 3,5-epimerase [Novosphingobium aerophilum]|uniref:dTDP-4-dehydrorhamnose 3,5-epimerase n=1 Tax=Novosphingobium aerophilum TaxID=2839843 RepID=A0A7X1F716_9SPHN|nr:dTDP-4-dehydrorhamnose 3,5-epimerase [Novosphingobium aerophilum]MBC2651551.1 dTDP-4-dehydrorhamnose 3,5-epimerase [Novosphingobium aerophilum]
MLFKTFDIPNLIEITCRRHGDERGYFAEVFRQRDFETHAGPIVFVQENESLSAKVGTVRGLHFQTDPHAQGKLVRCTAGAIFDAAVDLRRGSPTYGQWAAVELSPAKGNLFWIPAGFAHGFCTLEPDTVVNYKVTSYYAPECDKGVRWDDPAIAIDWPSVADPDTLSAKDRIQPLLAELPVCFSMTDS